MESIVHLSLGANIGDRHNNVAKAIELIESRVGNVIEKSSTYETEPMGFVSSDNFLNLCISIQTPLYPSTLLNELIKIEQEIGRTKKSSNGTYESRVIDIDIILFGEVIVNESALIIPHPRYHERLFVLEPLNEIAPNTLDPVSRKSIKQLYAECVDQ